MQSITITDIIRATEGSLLTGSPNMVITSISTDSRKMNPGCLFIPLIGDKFDGHDYINNAFEAGASAVLTQRGGLTFGDKTVIMVEDTSKALRDLAAFYRKRFTFPFVGITGSVGKTSTKDMIAGVVKKKFNVLKTEGNLNNEVGVPLTVFNIDAFHEAAVLEMGMSGAGEISRLTAIIKPDIAIITNVGMSHIEKLGSRQNILKAKLEILEGLNPDGLLVLNGDDSLLEGMKDLLKFRTVLYGLNEGVDYQAANINSHGENGIYFDIKIDGREYTVHVPVPGVHNVHNALAAIAVGCELNIPMEEVIKGIADFSPTKMRMDIITVNGMKIINDAYNASPQSMEAALRVLKEIECKSKRIAVLGDMLELGEWARKAHYEIGKYAASIGIDRILTIGKNARQIGDGARDGGIPEKCVMSFESNGDALSYLKSIFATGDVILVKGSRGMKMEELVKGLST